MAVGLINSTPSEIYYVNGYVSKKHRSLVTAIVDKLNKLPLTKETIYRGTCISRRRRTKLQTGATSCWRSHKYFRWRVTKKSLISRAHRNKICDGWEVLLDEVKSCAKFVVFFFFLFITRVAHKTKHTSLVWRNLHSSL